MKEEYENYNFEYYDKEKDRLSNIYIVAKTDIQAIKKFVKINKNKQISFTCKKSNKDIFTDEKYYKLMKQLKK